MELEDTLASGASDRKVVEVSQNAQHFGCLLSKAPRRGWNGPKAISTPAGRQIYVKHLLIADSIVHLGQRLGLFFGTAKLPAKSTGVEI